MRTDTTAQDSNFQVRRINWKRNQFLKVLGDQQQVRDSAVQLYSCIEHEAHNRVFRFEVTSMVFTNAGEDVLRAEIDNPSRVSAADLG